MRARLNGWRRIGIVLVSLWVIVLVSIAFSEYFTKSNGYFVYQGIPIGTVVEGSKVILPDGKTLSLTEEEEFQLRYAQEKNMKPWQINWSEFPTVPQISKVKWNRISYLILLVPVVLWLLIEITVIILSWVRKGFANESNNS